MTLSRIENGERALDKRSEIAALADALQITLSELIDLPESTPSNGEKDTVVQVVRCVRDVAELLPLATLLHVDVVPHWLHDAGAPEMRLQATALARDVAGEHGAKATGA